MLHTSLIRNTVIIMSKSAVNAIAFLGLHLPLLGRKALLVLNLTSLRCRAHSKKILDIIRTAYTCTLSGSSKS